MNMDPGVDGLDLALLPIGGQLPIRGEWWTITRRTPKAWTFDVAGKRRTVRLWTPKWIDFCREVEAAYCRSRHGSDGGCLCEVWPPRLPWQLTAMGGRP